MKKCANCAKDLPEAALHCVFCGSKQAAAPAVQPGLAKTAFGYSANEVMQQLGNQPPQQGGYQPPQQGGYQPPRPQGASQPPPMAAPVPSAANAATMMIQPGQGPQLPAAGGNPGFAPTAPQQPYGGSPGYGGPAPMGGGMGGSPGYGGGPAPMGGGMGGSPGYGGPAPMGGGMGIHAQPQNTPSPLPIAQPPPYLASQTAARAGRPIEPWKDSLRFMMFVFGAVALATFATPVTADPTTFNWDQIIDGAGKAKIPPMLWATVGLLSIALGAIPLASLPRGAIALTLGLAGALVPLFLDGMPEWRVLLMSVGMLVLVPGLIVRQEYTESLLARILITVGVVAFLLTVLIPNGGEIPLVQKFKGLVDAKDMKHRIGPILDIALLVIVVMTLIAWIPGPATGGAMLFAWAIILFPAVAVIVKFFLGESPLDHLSKRPGDIANWGDSVAYSVLIGYGGATVIGKQLE